MQALQKMLPHKRPPSDEVGQFGTNSKWTQNAEEIGQRKIHYHSECIYKSDKMFDVYHLFPIICSGKRIIIVPPAPELG